MIDELFVSLTSDSGFSELVSTALLLVIDVLVSCDTGSTIVCVESGASTPQRAAPASVTFEVVPSGYIVVDARAESIVETVSVPSVAVLDTISPPALRPARLRVAVTPRADVLATE